MRFSRKKYWRIIILLTIIAGVLLFVLRKKSKEVTVHSDLVARESLSQKVSATGTINPLQTVEVGTQVSGKISALYVDFNDRVKEGQVIARMDTRILLSTLKESEANLNQAEVQLIQAKREFDRVEGLLKNNAIATADYEIAKDNYQLARARYSSADLQLERNRTNLSFATITSPIDGVVISRKVDEGQTVAAAFATPAIYVIARDLKKMKIEASVDEADIGYVKAGQTATFTVDAFPDLVFEGKVEQVQLEPITLQNVVTYTVEILVDNPELKLMPGMTTNLEIIISSRENILTVPNGVFNFQMDEDLKKQLNTEGYDVANSPSQSDDMVWLFDGKSFVQRSVKKGYTNGIKTEINGAIKEGDEIVSRIEISATKKKTGRSFFMPERPEDKKEKE